MADKTAILFSRTVKAGKRVYYVDVKQDRRGEFYLSFTESKRVQDGTELSAPVFEKHKIFLYREDMMKFGEAFREAVAFVESQEQVQECGQWQDQDQEASAMQAEEISAEQFGFDVEF